MSLAENRYRENVGALTFSPSDNSTHTVISSDNWSAVCLVLVTFGLSSNPKVDDLFIQPKIEHLYPKIMEQLSQCDSCSHQIFGPPKLQHFVPSILVHFWPTQTVTFDPMFYLSMSPRLQTCFRLPP